MSFELLGGDIWHVVNLLALIIYILVKELFLDRKKLKEQLTDVQKKKDPLKALEIDLVALKTKVVNLEDAIGDQGDALCSKLDMLFQDFKEKHAENRADLNDIKKDFIKAHLDLSQRLSAVETELKRPKRR